MNGQPLYTVMVRAVAHEETARARRADIFIVVVLVALVEGRCRIATTACEYLYTTSICAYMMKASSQKRRTSVEDTLLYRPSWIGA